MKIAVDCYKDSQFYLSNSKETRLPLKKKNSYCHTIDIRIKFNFATPVKISCILIIIILYLRSSYPSENYPKMIRMLSEDYNKIRLMTFNTGLINDFHNTYNQILVEKPDIVQFQETSQEFRTKLKSLQSLLPYNVGLNEANNHFSSIILSKYPIKKDKEINNHAVVAKFS